MHACERTHAYLCRLYHVVSCYCCCFVSVPMHVIVFPDLFGGFLFMRLLAGYVFSFVLGERCYTCIFTGSELVSIPGNLMTAFNIVFACEYMYILFPTE